MIELALGRTDREAQGFITRATALPSSPYAKPEGVDDRGDMAVEPHFQ
jgi:hypothetical protein